MSKEDKIVPPLRFPDFMGDQQLEALRNHKKGLLQKFFCKPYFDGSVFKEIQGIFDVRNGYTPSKANKSFWDNGTIPWFRIDDIRENGRILNQSLKYVSQSALKGGKAFPANSLLVSTTATIGEYALITVEHLSNQRFVSLSPKRKYAHQINMTFMLYACFSLSEWCRRNTKPSNFASVEMDGFKKFRFPLPSLLLQEEIVQGLSAVDDVITAQEKKLEALRDHKKGLLQKFFCKPYFDGSVFATKWPHVKLVDVATVIAGQSPKAESYNKEAIGTPFMQGKKDYGDKFPTPTVWTKSVSKLAESGDILMSVRAPVGALNIANQRICIGRGLAAIRATDKISRRYLFYALLQISEDLEGDSGSIFNSINKKQIEEINFILPPSSEQKRIVATFDSVDDVIELEGQKLEALHDHKKGLLQQLFPKIEALSE